MPYDKHVYARNKTDAPQIIRHMKLRDVSVIPTAPGGYAIAENSQVTILPGQAFRVPITIWATQQSLYRAPWVERITEEEFKAALDADQAAAPAYDEKHAHILSGLLNGQCGECEPGDDGCEWAVIGEDYLGVTRACKKGAVRFLVGNGTDGTDKTDAGPDAGTRAKRARKKG